jgi:hypothetical protein
LKSFCETIPDKNLYDLIKDLNTMLEVGQAMEQGESGVRRMRIQSLTQTILGLSGSMSRVLEIVKSINTQNDWRIQGLSDMDRELENEHRGKLRRELKGMETGAV